MKTSITAALIALFAVSAYAEEKKVDWKLSFPENLKHFTKVQETWAKKDPHWNPTKEQIKATFDEADTNKDGVLTKEEWDARPKKK